MRPFGSLLRSVGHFSLATLISRVLGLVRDASFGAFLSKEVADAFWTGITLPSTFRMLFAEGALSAAFIPILSRLRAQESEEDAQRFTRSVLGLIVLIVGAVVVLAILTAPIYVSLLFHKWEDRPGGILLATQMVQMMFPFLFFISLSAWAMGILNTHNIFFLPAVSPALYNVVVISGAVFAGLHLSGVDRAYAMAIAVVAGGFSQFAIQIPSLYRRGYSLRAPFGGFHPETRAFLRALLPTVFGLAIYQVNVIVNRLYFGSYLEAGSITSLTCAFRLLQFPQGVLGVAVATAALPRLAHDALKSSSNVFCDTMTRSLRVLILILIPASVGLVIISHDLVGIVYNRGEFRRDGLLIPTASALVSFSIGLLFFSSGKLLTQGFYAHRDVKTPVKIGCVTVVVNVVCCRLLLGMGVSGLALASTIASSIQAMILFVVLLPRMPEFPSWRITLLTMKVVLFSAIMGAGCWFISSCLMHLGETSFGYFARVFTCVGAGVIVYGVLVWFFLRDEIVNLLEMRGVEE